MSLIKKEERNYYMMLGWDVIKLRNGLYALIEVTEMYGKRHFKEICESRSEYFLRNIILDQLRRDTQKSVEEGLESFREPEAYDMELYKIPNIKINMDTFRASRKDFDRFVFDLQSMAMKNIPEPEPFGGLMPKKLWEIIKNPSERNEQ